MGFPAESQQILIAIKIELSLAALSVLDFSLSSEPKLDHVLGAIHPCQSFMSKRA
jgi:hypothetical protein